MRVGVNVILPRNTWNTMKGQVPAFSVSMVMDYVIYYNVTLTFAVSPGETTDPFMNLVKVKLWDSVELCEY